LENSLKEMEIIYKLYDIDGNKKKEINKKRVAIHYFCGCLLGELGKSDYKKLSRAE
jgi:hypothetical protein